MMNHGHAFGPICLTTCRQPENAPLIDSGWTSVAKWGTDAHGSIVVRIPRTTRSGTFLAAVIVVRGTTARTFDRLLRRRPRRFHRSVYVEGGAAQAKS